MPRVFALLPLSLMLTACTTGSDQGPTGALVVTCESPRPQVCTMEYAPVCATLQDGGQRDYSSGCNACADDAVASWVSGKCDARVEGDDSSE